MRLPQRLHKHKCPSFIGETCPREGTGENEAAGSPISPEISLPFLTTRSVNTASLNHTVLQRGWPNKQHISPSTLRFNKPPGCEPELTQTCSKTVSVHGADFFHYVLRWTHPDFLCRRYMSHITWWQTEPEAQVFAGPLSEAARSHIKSQRRRKKKKNTRHFN